MLKLFLFWIFLIAWTFCFSQQKRDRDRWQLIIADSRTMHGMGNVTLSIGSKKVYVSNNKGAISINKASIHKNDTINVKFLGYRSISILMPNNNLYPDTIFLSSTVVPLQEVKISEVRSIKTVFGDVKKAFNTHRVTSPGSAYVQFIPNSTNTIGIITSVEYGLNDILHGIGMPFRLRLYTKNKYSLTLDRELSADSIIVYNPQKKHHLSVDISRYNIQFPENGVLVVFETLSPFYYSKDSTWYHGQKYAKTPGLDMDQTKNNWRADYQKTNKQSAYSMVGPAADRWNWDGLADQWYVYAEGNNFAISITVGQELTHTKRSD